VTDEDWQKFGVTLDNTGTKETGRLRVGLGYQNANMFDRDHVLNLQYVGAPYSNSTNEAGESDMLSFKPSDRVLIIGAGYHVPLYALGDALGGTDPQTLATFMDLVNGWLSARLGNGTAPKARLARLAETWEQINRAARDVETYNLERKPLVFAVFGALAEAARA